MTVIGKRFYLDSQEDADVLEWLERQANQSAAVRDAIRAQIGRAEEIKGELSVETLRRILREELARMTIQMDARQEGPGAGEDDETAGMLDDLLGAWDFEGG